MVPSIPSNSGSTGCTQRKEDGEIEKPPWEKILWRKQPYPDNYVPDSFLSELKTLPIRPRPRISSLIVAALPISQHLCAIAFFLSTFYALLTDGISASQVGWTCSLCVLIGNFLYNHGWQTSKTSKIADTYDLLPKSTPLRPLILPPLLLSLLSPVLGTLTSATTSDTIWPLSGGLFFLHLLLADFTTGPDARTKRLILLEKRTREAKRRGSVSESTDIKLEEVQEKSLTSSLSLTSALSASIVLASRLKSTSQVFSLVLLAVALFAGWPNIAKGVREAGRPYSIILTASSICLTLSILPSGNDESLVGTSFIVFLSVLSLVNVFGPVMLWYGWRWKTKRGGGWEVAVVRVRKDPKG